MAAATDHVTRALGVAAAPGGASHPADAGTAIPAVGYVHAPEGDRAALAAAAAKVRACGSRLGFDVRAVFRDDESSDWTDGFMAVLDEVRFSRARAVLVLTPDHLSPLADVRRWMAHMIATAGALLVVLDPTLPPPPTDRPHPPARHHVEDRPWDPRLLHREARRRESERRTNDDAGRSTHAGGPPVPEERGHRPRQP